MFIHATQTQECMAQNDMSPRFVHRQLPVLQFASDAEAARDGQHALQAAQQQAKQREAEVLAAADAGNK